MSNKASNLCRPAPARISARAGAGLVVPGFLLVWFLVSVLVHPLQHASADLIGAPLLPGSDIVPSVASVFEHACINCHSEKTLWPWYSLVAPASWFVEDDVKRARQHLNLSRWDNLDPAEQRIALTAIATVIENREMPPRRYVVFHSEAKLSLDDSVRVIEWTQAERRRLRTSSFTSTAK
jgi:hypothetical protein